MENEIKTTNDLKSVPKASNINSSNKNKTDKNKLNEVKSNDSQTSFSITNSISKNKTDKKQTNETKSNDLLQTQTSTSITNSISKNKTDKNQINDSEQTQTASTTNTSSKNNKTDKNNQLIDETNDKKNIDTSTGKITNAKQKLIDIDKKNGINYMMKVSIANMEDSDTEPLLGSVTHFTGNDSIHTVRTSARVIQKMRDSKRAPTPPKNEKNADEQPAPVLPAVKTKNSMWGNTERNLFFEALNEYGKDFDAIANYMNTKLKRQYSVETQTKIKKNIRVLYCQIFYKVLKYVKFSDEVKKVAQELYGIINYGEMRRKLLFINDKVLMKLGELVYKGSVSFRIKGKTIKIKTPSCRALRELNQLEEWQEEIKLPTKIDVLLKPANLESWGRVQTLAQNPRIKTTLPLQKRVSSFLLFLQQKWKSPELRIWDKTLQMQTAALTNNKINNRNKVNIDIDLQQTTIQTTMMLNDEPKICIGPSPDVIIHRPMVSLTEFLRSYRICLNSYEERIDAKVKGETLCTNRTNLLKELMKTNSKRQRHDSACDKKSPDLKKIKLDVDIKPIEKNCDKLEKITAAVTPTTPTTSETSTTKVTNNKNDITTAAVDDKIKIEGVTNDKDDKKNETEIGLKTEPVVSSNDKLESYLEETSVNFNKYINDNLNEESRLNRKKEKTNNKKTNNNQNHNNRRDSTTYRPLISEETIKKIRDGWTIDTVADLTFGDLYVMFGQDIKLNLEYSWVKVKQEPTAIEQPSTLITDTTSTTGITKPTTTTTSTTGTTKPTITSTTTTATAAAATTSSINTETDLKIQEIMSDEVSEILGSKLKQLLLIANMGKKSRKRINCTCGHVCDKTIKAKKHEDSSSYVSNKIHSPSQNDNMVFRQPTLPVRNHIGLSTYNTHKLLINNVGNRPRWLNSRNRLMFPSKQVVVQRLLPLQPGINPSYGLVSTTDTNIQTSPTQPSMRQQKININKIIDIKNNNNNNSKIKIDTIKNNNNNTNNINVVTPQQQQQHQQQQQQHSSPKINIIEKKTKENINNNNNNNNNDNNMEIVFQTITDDDQDDNSVDNNPGITSLMDISLPSSPLYNNNDDDRFDEYISVLPSPMGILHEISDGSNSQFRQTIQDENDFSFSSFLGHLDQLSDNENKSKSRDDMDSNLSVLSDTSIDYMSKFAQIAAELKERENDDDNSKNDIIGFL